MAMNQKKPHQTKPKTTYFFRCCFGCINEASEKKSVETVRSDGRKNTPWLYWFRFRGKKSGTKTVPVESTLSEKADPTNEIPASGSKPDKLKSRPQAQGTDHQLPSQTPVLAPVPSDKTPKAKGGHQGTRFGQARNLVQHLDHSDTSKKDTSQKWLSFRRKIEAIRTGSSQPSSPKAKPKPVAVVSHSVFLPVPVHEKRANPSSSSSTNSRAMSRKSSAEKLDPMVGLSIIVVTLIIMLVWGRLCAILCTFAWFYFVPRLSKNVGKNRNSHDQDYESGEHKKKVVLEGFLERNHRSPL